MSLLDTRALQMFVAVAHSLNFRQAAEQLHMSQPPLSRAIKTLEERLGVRLFDRDTQGVALTAAAVRLLPQAQAILVQLEAAERQLARHAAPGRLRLGLTSSLQPGLFEDLQQALTGRLGEAGVEVSFGPSPRLVAQLRAHRLDAALIGLPCATHELDVGRVGAQPLMLALPSAHPLARRGRVSLADIGAQSVYWFERARQPAYFDHCHEVFRRHAFAPRFLREPHDHHLLLGEVAAGRGLALLPTSFRSLKLRGVVYRALKEGAELAVGIGLARSARRHPAVEVLEQVSRQVFGPVA